MKYFLSFALLLNFVFAAQLSHACNPGAGTGQVILLLPVLIPWAIASDAIDHVLESHAEWKEPYAKKAFEKKLENFFANRNSTIKTPKHLYAPWNMMHLERNSDQKIVVKIFYELIEANYKERFLSLNKESVPELSLEYRKIFEAVNFLFHMKSKGHKYNFGRRMLVDMLQQFEHSYRFKFVSADEFQVLP